MKNLPDCSAGSTPVDARTHNAELPLWYGRLSGWGWNAPAEAEQEARQMFQRFLAGWAMDVLELRRRGLDRPVERRGCPGVAAPMRRLAG